MTTTMFIALLTIGAAVTSLLTEAIKKAYLNANIQYSANVVALVNAIIVGGIGTFTAYMLLGIPLIPSNILCLMLMIVAIWVGSMIGYDKIIQLLEQISIIGK